MHRVNDSNATIYQKIKVLANTGGLPASMFFVEHGEVYYRGKRIESYPPVELVAALRSIGCNL